ncbi:MAG: adenine phosphoribosyltransferase [Dehalococcoidia bacterium]|nr:MAG: adenine phosphoribosyltransferase [Dehalococcoidia bacterium]
MREDKVKLQDKIRDILDFPKKGVIFRDVTPLLRDAAAFRYVIDLLTEKYRDRGIDIIVAAEARGFIFGAPLAYNLGVGFAPVRKPAKLPAESISAEYALEYGVDSLHMHRDAIQPGQKVLIIDDLLATGGTVKAKIELVEKLGAEVVGIAFLIELTSFEGRKKLEGYDVCSLIQY